jgi:hypothetical protein
MVETVREPPLFQRNVVPKPTVPSTSTEDTLFCHEGQSATSDKMAKTASAGASIVTFARVVAGRMR